MKNSISHMYSLMLLGCPLGRYYFLGQCYSCPRGYYSESDLAQWCKGCPHGFTTESAGSSSIGNYTGEILSNYPHDGVFPKCKGKSVNLIIFSLTCVLLALC